MSVFTQIGKRLGRFLFRHAPAILTGIGIASNISSVIFAVKVTPRAARMLEEKKKELGVEKLPLKEIVKTCGRLYIPTALSMLSTTGCFVGINTAHGKQKAVIAGLYSGAMETIQSYQKKIAEELGPEKEKEIREEVNKEAKPMTPQQTVMLVGNGRYLYRFYGARAYLTERDVLRAESRLNKKMYGGPEMYVRVEEIAEELGMNPSSIPADIRRKTVSIDDGVEFLYEPIIDDTGEPGIELVLSCEPGDNDKVMYS